MANHLPSFASGSNLMIKIGNRTIAYGSSLSFTDDVAHGAVGGIGGYSYDANEPLSYIARGSFSVTLYSNITIQRLDEGKSGLKKPSRVSATQPAEYDGNSFLTDNSFNPLSLMLSNSFDITVMERNPDQLTPGTTVQTIFTVLGCRLGDYSLTFTPGSFVGENIGFMALQIVDSVGQPLTAAAANNLQTLGPA